MLLLLAAGRWFVPPGRPSSAIAKPRRSRRSSRALATGAGIGFVSGMTGVGGGIFLAPLVLVFGWTTTRQATAVSTVFNLLNCATAFAGAWATLPGRPAPLPWWLVAVGFGGLLGWWLGQRYLPPSALRFLLASILPVAAVRMIVT